MKKSHKQSLETSLKSQKTTANNPPQAMDDPTRSLGVKDILKLVLKLALVVGIFIFLFRKGLVTTHSFQLVFAQPGVLLLATLLMTINTLLGTYRWQQLLIPHGIHLTYVQALKYNLIGVFFNIALPGAVSGDVVKAVYVGRVPAYREKRAAIFGSVLFDRILGFSALIFVAVVSATYSLFVDWGHELPRALMGSVFAFGVAVVLGFAYLIFSHKVDPLFVLIKKLATRFPKLGSLERTYLGLIHYRNFPKQIANSVWVSLVIHVFIVSAVFLFASILSEQVIPFVALAIIVPVGLLATMIPILPAGVGTGHAAFYALFQLVGSTQGAEVFSWLVLFQVVIGLVGGVIYLRSK